MSKSETDDFKPFDDVADSMAAAASRLNVPLAKVKEMKRAGCGAIVAACSSTFRGDRVWLDRRTSSRE